MTQLQRIRVAWQGSAIIGPGVTTFYADASVGNMNADGVKAFFDAIKSKFVGGVTWTIPNNGDIIDSATGQLSGVWAGGTGGTVSGSAGAADYANGVGARIAWKTADVRNGRRVRGQTFLVPLIGAAFKSNGLIDPLTVTAFQSAADALISSQAGALAVWHRPKAGVAGSAAKVTAATVTNQVSWLRSRRT